MENELQKLPLGIQSFEDLRTNDYLYVDKTKDVFKLVNSGKPYFLSRPRRFGKSLLISTLENLFLGKKELFKGLYIYDKWDWNKTHPVIRIDFSGRTHETGVELKKSLNIFLTELAKENSIELVYENHNDKFGELIKKLYDNYGKVVVLIDEYDKPILDNVPYPNIRNEMKKVLHDFYQILKSQDDNLRFVFLTGVSKFVGTSIFSGLNSPDDLTVDNEFSTICGYTGDELECYFKPYYVKLAKKNKMSVSEILDNIKNWYNGYSWDGKNFVYNPQSVLSLFRKETFSNYWFSTATPTFLMDLLKEKEDLSMILSNVCAGSEILDSYDPENIPIVPLLFQSGYLTMKKIEIIDLEQNYTLDIPNKEVKDSFTKYLLNAYVKYPLNQVNSLRNRMRKNFLNKNSEDLNNNLREMLASIPYKLYNNNEAYFHSIFLIWLNLLGFKIEGEVVTNIGQMDAILIIDDSAIIIEIKFDKDKNKLDNLVIKALNQIMDSKYYEKYLNYDLIFLGIAFADKEVKCKFRKYLHY
ncbi:MAG: ATPase AAA [Methanobrevibacter sp. CfCl-M3]